MKCFRSAAGESGRTDLDFESSRTWRFNPLQFPQDYYTPPPVTKTTTFKKPAQNDILYNFPLLPAFGNGYDFLVALDHLWQFEFYTRCLKHRQDLQKILSGEKELKYAGDPTNRREALKKFDLKNIDSGIRYDSYSSIPNLKDNGKSFN